MKVSLLDVCGKVIGARSGVECIRTVFVFTHQRAILHAQNCLILTLLECVHCQLEIGTPFPGFPYQCQKPHGFATTSHSEVRSQEIRLGRSSKMPLTVTLGNVRSGVSCNCCLSFDCKLPTNAFCHPVEETASVQEEDLWKARFWQGFQSLSESSLSSGKGKVRNSLSSRVAFLMLPKY